MDAGPDLTRPLSQRLSGRLTSRHWLLTDVVVAVLLSATAVLATALEQHRAHPVGPGWEVVRYAAIQLACLPLALRRYRPGLAVLVMAPAIGLLAALGSRGPTLIGSAAVIYTLGSTRTRRTSLRATALLLGALVTGALLAPGAPAWGTLAAQAPVLLVGWLAGENTRDRRAYALAVAARTTERDADRAAQADRAVADERLRIARDLHDVVAHAMSVIAVRSGVARVVLDRRPDQAREALGIIETTSKQALAEMRLLVGVLRQSEDSPALAPAPGLADLADLVAQARESGLTVRLCLDPDLPVEREALLVPASVDLSAYRIVQEALTNVVRHAGPTSVDVSVRRTPTEVVIEVSDEGPRAGHQPPPPVHDGLGHGLVGMRERVGLFGGSLEAAPAGRGYRIHAVLPCDATTR